jgi:hypothetical protein
MNRKKKFPKKEFLPEPARNKTCLRVLLAPSHEPADDKRSVVRAARDAVHRERHRRCHRHDKVGPRAENKRQPWRPRRRAEWRMLMLMVMLMMLDPQCSVMMPHPAAPPAAPAPRSPRRPR